MIKKPFGDFKIKEEKHQCHDCKRWFKESELDMDRGDWVCNRCEHDRREDEFEGESR